MYVRLHVHGHTHTLTHTHFGRDAIASAFSCVRGRTHRADSALQPTVQQVPSLFCAVQGTPVNILNDTSAHAWLQETSTTEGFSQGPALCARYLTPSASKVSGPAHTSL